jgi:exopolysaccharide biosynthesis polyprenyl glycosylphosphotransferase
VGDSEDRHMPGPVNRYFGTPAALAEVVRKTRPARVVVGVSERRGYLPVQELLDLRLSGLRIEDVSTLYEAAFGRVCLQELRPSQLIFSPELGPRANKVLMQTAYSMAIALVGTLVTLPIMIAVALLVKLTSRGPIFYRQVRVGWNDRHFNVYKFRSMYVDAEAKTGAVWAQRDDPRVTPVGRWLRLLRLDELPQFFNVLKGEMVIVGPRPERPEFVKTLSEKIPYYRQRHCVKPGITGWAQINYKYGNTIEDTATKLEFDLYYIKNLAASLDFYIIFHTLKTMLLSRGAH